MCSQSYEGLIMKIIFVLWFIWADTPVELGWYATSTACMDARMSVTNHGYRPASSYLCVPVDNSGNHWKNKNRGIGR